MSKFILFVAIAFTALVSCTKEHEPTPSDPLTSVTIGKDTLTIVVGGTRKIDFTTSPPDYNPKLLTWTSSDSTIVAVSSIGIVTAKVPGIAKIKVRNAKNTVWADCLVFVLAKPQIPPVDSLKIGLLARYDFNNSGVDSSGNGYHAAVHNITSAPDRFGNVNGAYSFDGISSYLSVPDDQPLRLNNTDFTMNVWIKTSAYGNSYENDILAKRTTGADNGWALGLNGQLVNPAGALAFGPGGGSINAYGTIPVSVNQWHMVTVIYTLSTKQLNTYIDGVFNNTTTNFPSPNGLVNSLMYIGKDDPSIPSTGYFFEGSIDDIRIYSRAISKAQLQQLYLATN